MLSIRQLFIRPFLQQSKKIFFAKNAAYYILVLRAKGVCGIQAETIDF